MVKKYFPICGCSCALIISLSVACRPHESMLVRDNNDGSYSANWTPSSMGLYAIHVTIDGYQLGMYTMHGCPPQEPGRMPSLPS